LQRASFVVRDGRSSRAVAEDFQQEVIEMHWIAKVGCGLAASAVSLSAGEARACEAGPDSPAVNVSRSFPSGAAWSFDVSMAPCEGLVLSKVHYTPSGGVARLVLERATLAEVHVPYDNNAARFLDVTESTAGLGASALQLAADECGGQLHNAGTICVEDEDGGYRWKFDTAFAENHAVAVFVASQLGRYTYVNRWVFNENGTIEPEIGLTGQLQILSSNASDAPEFGSSLGPAGKVEVGLNHMHNFYYRLDFDLDGADNDVVSRVSFAPSSAEPGCEASACGKTTFTPISTESAQTWSALEQVTWLIQDKLTQNLDGRPIGYEIKPHYSGLWRGMTDGSEPWAQDELYVTRQNSCERFAARNVAPFLGDECPATNAPDVSAMVNGEATDGKNLVVWFVNRHHHVTRDEDQLMMPIEWTGFHIEPRSFSDSNPAP
jgi:primary-amine oxidase